MKNSNKNFGIVFFIFFAFLSFFPLLKNKDINIYFLIIAFLFLILGILNSTILTPLKKFWIRLGDILGIIISPLVMFFVYFVAVFFTKIFLLLFNKDILNLKMNKNIDTYWKYRDKSIKQSMDKQF